MREAMAHDRVQRRLDRVRSPRVQITYDVEMGGAIEMRELPFVIGVLADLSGQRAEPLPKLRDRKFITIDRDNFNDILRGHRPRLKFDVRNTLAGNGSKMSIELLFQSLEDFGPEGILQQIPMLQGFLAARTRLANLRSSLNDKLEDLIQEAVHNSNFLKAIEEEVHGNELLAGGPVEKLVETARLGTSKHDREMCTQGIREFFRQVLESDLVVSKDIPSSLDAHLSKMDAKLSEQLNEVLHTAQFQKLEASWRGIYYLVQHSETSSMLQIRLLNCSKDEVRRDLENVVEFDQSALFRKVYEEEYGVFGGAPYCALLGDYEFGRNPQDVALLESISHIAASAHAPFVSAVNPDLLNLKDFTELFHRRDLAKTFETSEYRKWKAFRRSEDSRYIGLVLPRILMRLPYGPDTVPIETFNFNEDTDGMDHSKYCWGNAVYAFGVRLASAFAKYGWCAAIRGVEGGGLVDGLPVHMFTTDDGNLEPKCPTEISISDRLEKEISDLGFITLVHCKGTDYAAFFSAHSCQRPMKYETDVANFNARLAAQLQYIMVISRFAHYIKVLIRDKVGSFNSRAECERYLNQWISNYVTPDDTATEAVKARFPLRDASIEVIEVMEIGKWQTYKAVAFLKPHFQLDELSASLRIVIDLPQQGRPKVTV
jgi:type VI secretion system protein ImpC